MDELNDVNMKTPYISEDITTTIYLGTFAVPNKKDQGYKMYTTAMGEICTAPQFIKMSWIGVVQRNPTHVELCC